MEQYSPTFYWAKVLCAIGLFWVLLNYWELMGIQGLRLNPLAWFVNLAFLGACGAFGFLVLDVKKELP